MHLKTYRGHFEKEQIKQKVYFPLDNYQMIDPGKNELLFVRKGLGLAQMIESSQRLSQSRSLQNAKHVRYFKFEFFPTEVKVSVALNLWAAFFVLPFLFLLLFTFVVPDQMGVKVAGLSAFVGIYFITKVKTAQIVDYLFEN